MKSIVPVLALVLLGTELLQGQVTQFPVPGGAVIATTKPVTPGVAGMTCIILPVPPVPPATLVTVIEAECTSGSTVIRPLGPITPLPNDYINIFGPQDGVFGYQQIQIVLYPRLANGGFWTYVFASDDTIPAPAFQMNYISGQF